MGKGEKMVYRHDNWSAEKKRCNMIEKMFLKWIRHTSMPCNYFTMEQKCLQLLGHIVQLKIMIFKWSVYSFKVKAISLIIYWSPRNASKLFFSARTHSYQTPSSIPTRGRNDWLVASMEWTTVHTNLIQRLFTFRTTTWLMLPWETMLPQTEKY